MTDGAHMLLCSKAARSICVWTVLLSSVHVYGISILECVRSNIGQRPRTNNASEWLDPGSCYHLPPVVMWVGQTPMSRGRTVSKHAMQFIFSLDIPKFLDVQEPIYHSTQLDGFRWRSMNPSPFWRQPRDPTGTLDNTRDPLGDQR